MLTTTHRRNPEVVFHRRVANTLSRNVGVHHLHLFSLPHHPHHPIQQPHLLLLLQTTAIVQLNDRRKVWPAASEDLKHENSKAVYVNSWCREGETIVVLRWHVPHRAGSLSGHVGVEWVDLPGKAEVCNVGFEVCIEEDIASLDVPAKSCKI